MTRICLLIALAHAAPTQATTWTEKREPVLTALAELKTHEPVDHLYPALEAERIDHTLWRWATTEDMPRLKSAATRWLGLTDYSPARFSRLISEMERAISLGDERAFDFMVAVAEMRQRTPAAAEQLRERVRRGLPPSLYAHYARSRFEYELSPAPDTLEAAITTLAGHPPHLGFLPAPTATEKVRAFAAALDYGNHSDLGAPTNLLGAMDMFLNMAPTPPLLQSLTLLRERPGGFEALLPRVNSLRVYHPERQVRRAAARAAFRLRGGVPATDLTLGNVFTLGPRLAQENYRAWREGFSTVMERACERALYVRD